ncbi:preprotein translocase subunit SecD [Alcaligenes sp. WGS1538]|uniref:SecDF P1 head subdomain-containing protein n=1 Tax=Alcaligenes sp. WGS1538 TaxID=3366811 RepID=UPI00372D691E
MSLTTRALLPSLLAAVLTLAGCQNMPSTSPQASSGGAPPSAADSRTVQPVAIYLAQLQPGPELVTVQVPEGIIYLQPRPILTRKDLTEAAALADRQGGNFVGLRFTSDGAERLRGASRENAGAMLALVIGRELVAAPRITEPLERGILAFKVPSVQAAESLAARIRGDSAR